jgi:malonyl-CoA O-methyltransferase
MKFFEIPGVEKKQGNLTNIPYENNKFDFTYSCEALEHAVDISSAIREMCRVTKSGGYVAVIDKNKDMLGYYDIEEWEQWFDENELKQELLKYCSDVIVKKNINFDDKPANGLFYCWIGKIK